jgi:hypothetical protein
MIFAIGVGDKVVMTDTADEREFKSGSRGYFVGGKCVIDGKRYQVSMNITEIGSKPK